MNLSDCESKIYSGSGKIIDFGPPEPGDKIIVKPGREVSVTVIVEKVVGSNISEKIFGSVTSDIKDMSNIPVGTDLEFDLGKVFVVIRP